MYQGSSFFLSQAMNFVETVSSRLVGDTSLFEMFCGRVRSTLSNLCVKRGPLCLMRFAVVVMAHGEKSCSRNY